MAGLHDPTGRDRAVATAGVALMKAQTMRLALQARHALDRAAVRVEGAIWPPVSLHVLPGGFFVLEDRVCQIDRRGGRSLPFFLSTGLARCAKLDARTASRQPSCRWRIRRAG